MIVIKHKEQLLGDLGEAVDEFSEHIWERRRWLCSHTGHEISTQAGLHTVQRREHIPPEAYQVIILLIKRNPGYPDGLWRQRLHPLCE
jgi:hypothetical protein